MFEDRLLRDSMPILRGMLRSGALITFSVQHFEKRKIPFTVSSANRQLLHGSAAERDEILVDVLMHARKSFRQKALVEGGWNPSFKGPKGSCCLLTYFIGRCLWDFRRVYLRWARQREIIAREEAAPADPDAFLQVLRATPHHWEPEEILFGGHFMDLLYTQPAETQAVVRLTYEGYSDGEIVDLLHSTPGAVRTRRYRFKSVLYQAAREGKIWIPAQLHVNGRRVPRRDDGLLFLILVLDVRILGAVPAEAIGSDTARPLNVCLRRGDHPERFPLADLGLDASGVTLPPEMTERLAVHAARVRQDADLARVQHEQAQRRRHKAASRHSRRPWKPAPLPPVLPVPRPAEGPPVCDVCHRPLAEPLVRYGRHILCSGRHGGLDPPTPSGGGPGLHSAISSSGRQSEHAACLVDGTDFRNAQCSAQTSSGLDKAGFRGVQPHGVDRVGAHGLPASWSRSYAAKHPPRQRHAPLRTRPPPRKHPRVGGEDSSRSCLSALTCEAPPPRRGEPGLEADPDALRRSTPASAGRTSARRRPRARPGERSCVSLAGRCAVTRVADVAGGRDGR
ncbi:hypothetical protein [Streptomyces sp. NPDC005859]|uniref:hypothetical protein n=1 Tax=Streptomyces sp. NPDC005859 TaxID=3157170 RepID=UPI0033D131A0